MEKITVLITGASRGIGLAIAKRLAPSASHLLITSREQSSIVRAKHELEDKYGVRVSCMSADHTEALIAAKAIGKWAGEQVTAIDLLVLNAGYYVEGALQSISPDNFEENLRVNFIVNHYLVQELIPLVAASSLKRIVFIGSTAAYEPYPAVPTYGIAKWALRGYASNLRYELTKDRIGVTFVAPGGTLTDMWAGEELPPNRLLDPDDIAKLVATLITLSPQAVVEELICRPMLGDIHE